MRPRNLSAPQLSMYLACPRKYAFRYVERIEPEFRSSALAFDASTLTRMDRGVLMRMNPLRR